MPALYSLTAFQDLVRANQWDILHDREYEKTIEKYGWDTNMVKAILLALDRDDYQKTFQNCRVNVQYYKSLDPIDGDQYQIFWDEQNMRRCSAKYMPSVDISMKICIAEFRGEFGGILTMHPSRWS